MITKTKQRLLPMFWTSYRIETINKTYKFDNTIFMIFMSVVLFCGNLLSAVCFIKQNLMQICWSTYPVIVNAMVIQYMNSLNSIHCLLLSQTPVKCLCIHNIHTQGSSHLLPSYFKAMESVWKIFIMGGYFLNRPHTCFYFINVGTNKQNNWLYNIRIIRFVKCKQYIEVNSRKVQGVEIRMNPARSGFILTAF